MKAKVAQVSAIDFEATSSTMERLNEDLKRAALASEAKLEKFTEYLMSKICKRRDQVKESI
jgi:hypothetical protein